MIARRAALAAVLVVTASCGRCGSGPRDLAPRVARALEQNVPGARARVADAHTVEVTLAGGGKPAIVSLDNLELACRAQPADCDDAFARYVETTSRSLAMVAVDAGPPKPSAVRVVFKTPDYLAAVKKRIDESPADKREDNALVTAPWAGDLTLVAVLDEPDRMVMVTRETTRALALDERGIIALARANLDAQLAPPVLEPLEGQPDIFVVRTGAEYASTQVLFPQRFATAAQKLEGLVVAIPARDLLLVAAAAHVPALRRVATEWVQTKPYSLSDRVFRWSETGWTALPP